jgi:hypothetical protein
VCHPDQVGVARTTSPSTWLVVRVSQLGAPLQRNGLHRFWVTHRDKRSKAALNSSIESIPGIGEKTMLT